MARGATLLQRGAERHLGYEPEDVIGKRYYDFFTPEDREQLLPAAKAAFARKEVFVRLVNRNVHKDGHVVVLETTGMPMLDAEGNLLGYRGVDQDITERKRADEALRESEERFRRLGDATTEGIAIHDQGSILDANQAGRNVYDVSEIIGQHRFEFIAPEALRPHLANILSGVSRTRRSA
jgi:PAS domain S-box-containing protein